MVSRQGFIFLVLIFIVSILLIGVVIFFNLFSWFDLIGEPQKSVEVTTESERVLKNTQTIGTSVEGRPISAHTYGSGSKHLLMIGGIHGGYEWNSVLLAYMMMDYLEANPSVVPTEMKITIIPSANPDGVFKVLGQEGRFTLENAPKPDDGTGQGRFNARGVDLNRNFACRWQAESSWRSKVVSAGTAPFSEPEARAIRDFIQTNDLTAVLTWHSQSNAIYAAECGAGVSEGTIALINAYSVASGYPAVMTFDHYAITGDLEGWLATLGIPAITVELSTHETVEWAKNLAGFKAVIELYR